MQVRFQGKGLVGRRAVDLRLHRLAGAGVAEQQRQLERAAIVGSVVRTMPHSSDGGTAPAGVVASFYAVKQA